MSTAPTTRRRPGPVPDADRPERIVAAARACFGRWGVDRTRMEDIAREAGVPRPALYRHFDSKDDLILAVMVDHIERRGRELRRQVRMRGPAGPIIRRVLLTGIVGESDDNVSASVLSTAVVRDTARFVAGSELIAGAMRDYWTPYLRYAEARGELRDGVAIDDAVRWLTLVVFYLLAIPELAPERAQLERYLDTFVVAAIVS